MSNGCPAIIGLASSPQELAQQTSNSIRCNLSLAPPGFFSPFPSVIFPPPVSRRRSRRRKPPSDDPAKQRVPLGGDQLIDPMPHTELCDACAKCDHCPTKITEKIVTLTTGGEEILPRNERRQSIFFSSSQNVLFYLAMKPISLAKIEPMLVFQGPGEREILAKDYGTFIQKTWYGMQTTGGNINLIVNEVTTTIC